MSSPARVSSRQLTGSDVDLVASVAGVLSRPRVKPADSFVLHAPLELAARAALLPFVDPARRDDARARIAEVAIGFEAYDAAVADPEPRAYDSVESGAAALAAAVAAGDLDDVDAAAAWLGASRASDLPRLLATDVVPRLAAAAHAPIFLYHLPRVAPRAEVPGTILRPLARELARNPDWRLTWPDAVAPAAPATGDDVARALAATPILGSPGSDFIFPLMTQAEASGVAADVLTPVLGVDFESGARGVLRTAARSMLLEPPDHAPYGWSHCLTMPQAVLGVAHACADPRRAFAVAATYVVGFRTALGSGPLGDVYDPEPVTTDRVSAYGAGPQAAAAAVWHTPVDERAAVVGELATRASVHHDAHLVKYTLACLDAAAWDPAAARTYLAAAASLVGFWSVR